LKTRSGFIRSTCVTPALAAISRVVAPSNDRSENKSAAAARFGLESGSAHGRVTRFIDFVSSFATILS
jgi:hypothetical protein